MSNPKTPKLSVKVLINKQKSKVLYAEVNSDFVDVLLSFLTLPLGKIVRILEIHYGKHAPSIGSLSTLYQGLYHLDSAHFFVGGAKEMFLDPRGSFEPECRKLVLDITDSDPAKYFVCRHECSNYVGCISLYSSIAACSFCGKPLNTKISRWESLAGDGGYGVFVKSSSTFVISKNLRIVPVKPGFMRTSVVAGVLEVLDNLGITETEGSEVRTLSFAMDDVTDLLKFSLISATPLTDLILKNDRKGFTAGKPEPGIFSRHAFKEAVSGNSKKMNLKVLLHKAKNKFVFAEATDEFLEFLFSFLTIPLGGVESLLGGKTYLQNIDNLYRSMADLIGVEHFKTPNTKNRLVNPKLGYGYISDNQFLPLIEERPPKLYYRRSSDLPSRFRRYVPIDQRSKHSYTEVVQSFKWVRGNGNYVNKPTICFVTDDLTVNPSFAPIASILNGLGVHLSDLKEMELLIGREEALSILKASLTSKTVLTDALINPMLHKLPKLEH